MRVTLASGNNGQVHQGLAIVDCQVSVQAAQNEPYVWRDLVVPLGPTSVVYDENGAASQPQLDPGQGYTGSVTVFDDQGNQAVNQATFTAQ